jgi:cytochrome bd-type quinol oxidase subunit 2
MEEEQILDGLEELSKLDPKKIATNAILIGVIIIFLIFLVIGFTLSILTTIRDTCDDTRKRAAAGNITLASIQFVCLVAAVGYFIYLSRAGNNFDLWVMSYLVIMMIGSFIQITTAGMVADDNKQADSAQGLMTTTGLMMLISIFYLLVSYFYIRSNFSKLIAIAKAKEQYVAKQTTELNNMFNTVSDLVKDISKS